MLQNFTIIFAQYLQATFDFEGLLTMTKTDFRVVNYARYQDSLRNVKLKTFEGNELQTQKKLIEDESSLNYHRN